MIAATITIDTEADHRGDRWVKTVPLAFRSVTEGVPHVMAPLFRKHGARPTYLLTTEVMNDGESVETLATWRKQLADAGVKTSSERTVQVDRDQYLKLLKARAEAARDADKEDNHVEAHLPILQQASRTAQHAS